MLDTTKDTPHGLLGRMVDWIADRLRASRELAELSGADVHEMAADLGLSEDELRAVLPRAADNTRLMDGMMRARGLDPDWVRRLSAALMRDLELTCTRCPNPARCRAELRVGTAAANSREFCANAGTFDALLEERRVA